MKLNKTNSIVIYKKLLRYVLPFWKAFVVAIIAGVCYSSIDAWLVHFLQPLLNKGFIDRDPEFIQWLPIIVIGAFIARASANITSNFLMTYVARSVIMVLRQQLFRHYQQMPSLAFAKNAKGKLLSAIIFNVQQVANASSDALTTFLQAFVLVIGLLVVMFKNSWQLSLIFFVALPVIAAVVAMASRHIRRYSLSIQASMGKVTAIAEENINGYKVVRTYGGQAYEQQRFDHVTRRNRALELKVAIAKSMSVSGVQLLAAIALAIIIYLATSGNHHFGLTAGSFTALFAAMLAILKPLKDLANVNSKIQQGLAGASAVFAVLDSPVESNQGQQVADNIKGKLAINHLSFKYPEADKQVLDNVSITVNPGDIVALVGRSGSGKTTLVNLLMRFYNYTDGSIQLDDTEVSSFELAHYRQQFAFVTQQVVLFEGSVAQNIAYGVPEALIDHERVQHAAKVAHATEFIDTLSDGFDTEIGQDGVLLSGGQRQRLALARAVYKKAPILVLDEATSALDAESEQYIQEALDNLMHQCTTVVIAHRLSTIKQADSIVVMDHGRVVEQGKHEALLAQQGHYAKLYDLQFNDE